jgi:hypothetical protein
MASARSLPSARGSILVPGLHLGCVFTAKASASSDLIQNLEPNWQLFKINKHLAENCNSLTLSSGVDIRAYYGRLIFGDLDWSAQLVTHISNKGEQMVRYYGFYSNKSRGLRKKAGTDDQVPVLIDSDISRKAFRKNWARLIQKIYNIDPSLCLKYLKPIKIIFFIEDEQLVKKML